MTPSRPPTSTELPRFSTRPYLWLRPTQPLVCPHLIDGYSHKLRTNSHALRDGDDEAFTCQFQRTKDAIQCGAVVYVLHFPGGMKFVAQVQYPEIKQLHGKQIPEILEYLGNTNPFALEPAPARSA